MATEDEALVAAFEAAVRQNGRVSGADSVSAYHEMDDADEAAPRAALMARLMASRIDAPEAPADLFGEREPSRVNGSDYTHVLKSAPEPFSLHLNDNLNHEIRLADRDYRVGDKLRLREWDGTSYTSSELTLLVTCLTPGGEWGLPRGLCVLGVEHMELDDWNEQSCAASSDTTAED